MKRIFLERTFETTPELLWELIVDVDHYRYWTEAFCKGSDFMGDWSKESDIYFYAENDSGLDSGMVSKVVESIWPSKISIEHRGVLVDGVFDAASNDSKKWAPAYENYRLIKLSDKLTRFELEQDLPDEEESNFIGLWEEAFDRMKTYIETSPNLGRVIAIKAKSDHSPKVIWERLSNPEKVKEWNFATLDWHCPEAKNNFEIGGEFHYEMAAIDGSVSFDFWGTYVDIRQPFSLGYELGDGRKVALTLIEKEDGCIIEERFEVEGENDLHLQRLGWLAILKRLAL